MGEAVNKVCVICGQEYIPVNGQYKRQKYCSTSCKHKMRWMRRKEMGIYTGGYSRYIYIMLWLRAMGLESYTATCHYCGEDLEPDRFNIDHKVPRSIIRDNKKLKNDMDNMVISCLTCNGLKGSTEYETFKARMKLNNG